LRSTERVASGRRPNDLFKVRLDPTRCGDRRAARAEAENDVK
jgi:hypothetical protein